MATTSNTITATAGQTEFSFSFPYLKKESIKVTIDTVVTTAFTIPDNNPTTVILNSGATAGQVIKISRLTSTTATPATFFSGGAIRSQDLNDNFDSILYITQERENQTEEIIQCGIADGSITSSKLADQSVGTAALIDGGVATVDLADNAVTTPKIVNDAVTTDKIIDDAVTTPKIVNDAVTSAKIADGTILNINVNAAAAIDGTKISPDFGSQNIITTGTVSATSVSGTMRYETAVTVTSGNVVNFDNLPSWAKRIKVVGYTVSFTGVNDALALRLKTSSGAVTSGYRSSSSANYYDGSIQRIISTPAAGAFVYGFGQASTVRDFEHTFTNLATTGNPNVWVSTGIMGAQYNSGVAYGTVTAGGVINTLGAVTGVQVFSQLGSAFDSGTMTVICEG